VAGEAKAPSEAEQTGFNFGANEAKKQGVMAGFGNIPVLPSKFVNLRK
jgi:hypothetical protein